MSIEMEELKNRLENLEISGSKKAITLSGFEPLSSRKQDITRELENFFEDKLGLFLTIEDHFKMGTIFVIYFQLIYDKRDAMRFKYSLKGIQNSKNKSLFINDYVPAVTQEKRRLEKQIIHESENKDPPLEVKYVRGKLTIQGETYKPKISPPSPKDLVDIEPPGKQGDNSTREKYLRRLHSKYIKSSAHTSALHQN